MSDAGQMLDPDEPLPWWASLLMVLLILALVAAFWIAMALALGWG